MINNVTLDELAKHSRNVLLVGMGGIGKSMMMRHLFLTSIREYYTKRNFTNIGYTA